MRLAKFIALDSSSDALLKSSAAGSRTHGGSGILPLICKDFSRATSPLYFRLKMTGKPRRAFRGRRKRTSSADNPPTATAGVKSRKMNQCEIGIKHSPDGPPAFRTDS